MAIIISKRIVRLLILIIASFVFFGLLFSSSSSKFVDDKTVENTKKILNDYIPDFIGSSLSSDDGTNDNEAAEMIEETITEVVDGDNVQAVIDDDVQIATNNKVKACFVSLVRNDDMWNILDSVRGVEDRFNKKYQYPWIFLNDQEFSEDFKTTVSNVINGEVKFGVIPEEHWSYPEWIDQEKAAQTRIDMAKIIYGSSESYRHMCRFESGFFWRHPLLEEYDWYWRVEPDTKLYCDVDYDVFKWMQDNDKVYGFTISIHEYESTIKTLWATTMKFVKEHPEYVAKDNMMNFISDDKGKTYNLCHFWSNFEIASLNFWRSDAYRAYFDYLDHAGGFFYERWGDAPVHSIAAALFLPRDKVHFFEGIGYYHPPYHNCPIDINVWTENKCGCDRGQDFTFQGYSCGNKYFEANNMEKPEGWEAFD
ncbi:glycosyltransferase family 15 protein SCDLUD_001976 [Saccharomycodes ludwigii]|uniref:glycosyltransferase family 15 protein n=1 Tax=Saccharomycodes ludwigii TaxID=36035 RepID=UPI001E83D97E|nr:hypothetical protein SCDLUD_001976 [Saccharomycodes ludwigii]KAH3902162.1 hypothetical protein SCDLUD_001976 [Saccharomycodes ludwigii]